MVPWVTNISAITSLRRGGERGRGGGRDKGPLSRSWQWGTLRGGVRRPRWRRESAGVPMPDSATGWITPSANQQEAQGQGNPLMRPPGGSEGRGGSRTWIREGGEETLHTMDHKNVFVSLSVKRTHTLINWEATWRYNSQETPYMLKKFLQTFSSSWECLQKTCISILPDLFVIFKQ